MGYAVYEDRPALDYGVERWAGYGVPAVCDYPECDTEIDRGMGFRCSENAMGKKSCEMHFCPEHLYDHKSHKHSVPKPDTAEWEAHVLADESWAEWRDQNPEKVASMRARADREEKP